jgi:lactoylglutathione lyase
MIKRLAHVCVKTNRFEEAIAFYRDTLGLPVKFTLDLHDGRRFGYYFDLGGTSFLELFDQAGAAEMWGGGPQALKQHHDSFYQHFCLQVEGIEAYREGLVKKGLAVTETALGVDGSVQCWIKDPDGNDIELMEYTDKSLQIQ